ncbi:MAG: ATP synthase F1 subunit epsilon [Erysipelotrichaceae bacterium]|nr:ATP synthase F1 subunit epsilon [Erysipelotrichaceae bacterium]
MIKLKIMTPSGVYFQGNATMINIKTSEGQRGILPNHMPLVTDLVISHLEVKDGLEKEEYAISNGLFYFKNNEASILVDTIENVKDIDMKRAQAAYDRAFKRLSKPDANIDILRAELALKKALNRLEK